MSRSCAGQAVDETGGLNPALYVRCCLRRTKAKAICLASCLASGGNLRAAQLPFGHSPMVRIQKYPGLKAGQALDMARRLLPWRFLLWRLLLWRLLHCR